jgi:hypothetical protein
MEAETLRIDWPVMAPDQDAWLLRGTHKVAERAGSVAEIDRACRTGSYVYVDIEEVDGEQNGRPYANTRTLVRNRYQIWGAWLDGSARERELGRGQCWVSVGPGETKRVIAIRDAIITTDSFDRGKLEMSTESAALPVNKKPAKAASKKKPAKAEKPPPAQNDEQDPAQQAAPDNGNVAIAEDVVGKRNQHVQARIPGTERVANPRVEAKALELYAAQEERLAAAKLEQALRKELTKLMIEANIPEQELPGGLIAECPTEPKAKVHKVKNRQQVAATDPGPEGMEAALADAEGEDD